MIQLEQLPASRRQLLAVGILLIFLLILYLFLVRPYLEAYNEHESQLITLQERLQRYQSVAGSRALIEQRLKEVANNPQTRDFYLSQETVALASAELQQLVKEAVVSSGGRLISTQIVQHQTQNSTPPVTVKVTMRGTIEAVHESFHRLESGRPLLFLNDVTVRGIATARYSARRRYRRSSNADEEGPALSVSFELTGYAVVKG